MYIGQKNIRLLHDTWYLMAYLLKSIRSAYVCSFFSDNQLAHCIIQPCNNCQTALPDGSNESPPFQKRLHYNGTMN